MVGPLVAFCGAEYITAVVKTKDAHRERLLLGGVEIRKIPAV
jgi:hypothetical protein